MIAAVRARGVICHDSPHLSLHQPHALSWPPFATIAFHKRSVSAWSSVATWNENASLCLNAGPPVQAETRDAHHRELYCQDITLLARGIIPHHTIPRAAIDVTDAPMIR